MAISRHACGAGSIIFAGDIFFLKFLYIVNYLLDL